MPRKPNLIETGQTDGTPAPVFDWDALTPPVDAPANTYTVGAQFDPIADTPKPIRERIETSLTDSVAAIKRATDAGKKANTVSPQWKLQAVTDKAMAEKLVKLMRKYAQYRPEKDVEFYTPGNPVGQITLRGAAVHYVPEGHADLKSDQAPVKLITKPVPEGIAAGWYVRYAAKPLESRSPSGKK